MEERCSNCKYFLRLKHNFQKEKGFEESYACDVTMHLLDNDENDIEPWIQEVNPLSMCEMFTEKTS